MSDDVGLQRAILASLQSPARPAPQPRGPSIITPSVGRVDRLLREGIVPRQKKPLQKEPSRTEVTANIVNRPIVTSRSEKSYNKTSSREARKSVPTTPKTPNSTHPLPPFSSRSLHSQSDPLPPFSSSNPSSSSSSSSSTFSSPYSHESSYDSLSSTPNYRHPPSRSISQPSFSPEDNHTFSTDNDFPPHYSHSYQNIPPVSLTFPSSSLNSFSSLNSSSFNSHSNVPMPDKNEWEVIGPGAIVVKSNSEFQIESPNKLLSIASLWSHQSIEVMHANNFSISLQVKVFPSCSGKLAENLVFYVFLLTSNNNPNDPISASEPYTCVSVNMYKKLVQVEQLIITRQTKTPTVLDQILLPSIKTSSFFDLKLTIIDNCKLDVFVDNSCVLSSVFIQHNYIKYPRFGCGVRGKGVATVRNLSFVNSQNTSLDSTPKQSLPPYTGDDKDLVSLIERDVLSYNLGITWDSIAGLSDAKRLLNEAVILPALLPDYFTGIREPWKGVLLFGPPGTGKTMLAKAVASQSNTTFFNVSTATLLSKWHGESSRLVRVLFNMARYYAPSTVFLDEIDALMGTRGASNEHEATRQLKSELLQQIDGICTLGKDGEKKRVTFLAASNFPWLIDDALRRRLEKRIYIPLPELEGRVELLKLQLKSVKLHNDVDLPFLAQKMTGYSAADITMVCRDASMMAMRAVITGLDPDQIKNIRKEDIDAPVRTDDFLNALKKIKSSVSPGEVQKYDNWEEEFGSC